VDAGGHAWVVGGTGSAESSFPVTVGPDVTHNGGEDAYAARVNPAGTGLDLCGYIGGAANDAAGGVAVDARGHAFVMGGTGSDEATFPVKNGPDPSFNGLADAFIAKVAPALTADAYAISEQGGQSIFHLTAGTENASRYHLLLGGVTGTQPGFPLPGGFAVLPLNWDPFTDLVLLLINSPVFAGFMGPLDAQGEASATLNLPPLPPGTAGLIVHFAYCLNNPFDFASNPVAVEVVP
jgi:hypothetical protein